MLELDNTKRNTFACPRKHQNINLRRIKPNTGSCAIRYGVGWHAAKEGYYKHIAENGWLHDGNALSQAAEYAKKAWDEASDEQEFFYDYRTFENLIQSFVQYIDYFYSDEGMLKIIDTEKVFKILMTPTDEEKKLFPELEPFWFTGRLDMEVELNGRPWLYETKSTGQSLTTQSERLHRSPQVIGYNYASKRVHDIIPDGTLMSYHYIYSRKKKDGTYGKVTIDFKRIPEIFDEIDLMNWKYDLYDTAQAIQRAERIGYYVMRLDQCYTYGRCTYLNLCEQKRAVGDEVLAEYYIADEAWDVTKDAGDKLVVIE